MEDRASSATQEIESLRNAHQEELDRLVRKYNKEYNEMLTQQMDEQDRLRCAAAGPGVAARLCPVAGALTLLVAGACLLQECAGWGAE